MVFTVLSKEPYQYHHEKHLVVASGCFWLFEGPSEMFLYLKIYWDLIPCSSILCDDPLCCCSRRVIVFVSVAGVSLTERRWPSLPHRRYLVAVLLTWWLHLRWFIEGVSTFGNINNFTVSSVSVSVHSAVITFLLFNTGKSPCLKGKKP